MKEPTTGAQVLALKLYTLEDHPGPVYGLEGLAELIDEHTRAPELLAALKKAIKALNTMPRRDIPALAMDSYKLVSELERILARAEGGKS